MYLQVPATGREFLEVNFPFETGRALIEEDSWHSFSLLYIFMHVEKRTTVGSAV